MKTNLRKSIEIAMGDEIASFIAMESFRINSESFRMNSRIAMMLIESEVVLDDWTLTTKWAERINKKLNIDDIDYTVFCCIRYVKEYVKAVQGTRKVIKIIDNIC